MRKVIVVKIKKKKKYIDEQTNKQTNKQKTNKIHLKSLGGAKYGSFFFWPVALFFSFLFYD